MCEKAIQYHIDTHLPQLHTQLQATQVQTFKFFATKIRFIFSLFIFMTAEIPVLDVYSKWTLPRCIIVNAMVKEKKTGKYFHVHYQNGPLEGTSDYPVYSSLASILLIFLIFSDCR